MLRLLALELPSCREDEDTRPLDGASGRRSGEVGVNRSDSDSARRSTGANRAAPDVRSSIPRAINVRLSREARVTLGTGIGIRPSRAGTARTSADLETDEWRIVLTPDTRPAD